MEPEPGSASFSHIGKLFKAVISFSSTRSVLFSPARSLVELSSNRQQLTSAALCEKGLIEEATLIGQRHELMWVTAHCAYSAQLAFTFTS